MGRVKGMGGGRWRAGRGGGWNRGGGVRGGEELGRGGMKSVGGKRAGEGNRRGGLGKGREGEIGCVGRESIKQK